MVQDEAIRDCCGGVDAGGTSGRLHHAPRNQKSVPSYGVRARQREAGRMSEAIDRSGHVSAAWWWRADRAAVAIADTLAGELH